MVPMVPFVGKHLAEDLTPALLAGNTIDVYDHPTVDLIRGLSRIPPGPPRGRRPPSPGGGGRAAGPFLGGISRLADGLAEIRKT